MSKQSAVRVIPYAWVILVVVYLASVVAPFNQFKIPPVMPVLMEAFTINLAQAGWLMSILAITGLVLALPAGIILQRLGLKFSALVALGCLGAGSGLGAIANSYSFLLASRVIEGAGIGLISVVAPAAIAMWFPPEKQGVAMGIWATWVPVGSLIMYNLAPALADALGWQSIWWVGLSFAMAMLVLSALLLRLPPDRGEASEPEPAHSDLRAALANRNIWLLAAEFAAFNLALIGLATYYPTYLNTVRGYSLGRAAFVSSLGTFVILGAAPLSGWLSDRINSRRLVFSIPFLAVAGLFLFPFTVTGWQIPLWMIVQGIITAAIPTATFAAAPEVMRRPQSAGLGLSLVLTGQYLGQLAGPVLFGQLANNLGWAMAGYLMIPVCLFGFICAWMVKVR
jgi:predicted MFS family arabinose efflux permease